LDEEQIQRLFESLFQSSNPDVHLVARLSLSTGARWSEVQALASQDVQLSPGLLTFKAASSVPIDDALAAELRQRLERGRFLYCYSAFRSAIHRAGIELPKGQLAHVPRHTFASHFVKNGGDILTLQRILGHSSLTVTMGYAHLSPGFLDQAKKLNPLARLTIR
jgi:site-specific recombinase XerD